MKKTIIILVGVVLVGLGVYFFTQNSPSVSNITENQEVATSTDKMESDQLTDKKPVEVLTNPGESVIGKSVEGRSITAYHYGNGDKEILFVGGIHGGYAWNTVSVAYELIDYLKGNPEAVPANLKVTVIPVLNPDGLNKTIGKEGRFTSADVPKTAGATVPGRFNANTVDLNRNFDCDWQAKGVWQNKTVDGGSRAFSEPESQSIKKYIEANNPEAVVVWYSAAGGVFASNCHNGVSEETKTITSVYSKASGYKAYEEFNFYEITGDMVNWLAKINVPAISVLLTTHESVEWAKNKAGIDALFAHYAK